MLGVLACAAALLFAGAILPSPVLAQIAPGVTQSAAHTANVAGRVTSPSGAPVAGAAVKLVGAQVFVATTNSDGRFGLSSVPYGTYQLVVSSSLGTVTRSVTLSGDVNVAVAYQTPSNLKTIAHVSTGSAGANINVTPASVYSVNPRDAVFEQNATWRDILDQVPGVSPSGYSTMTTYISGSPFQPTVISINGALPYETSTTLDGMPFYNSTFGINNSVGNGANLNSLSMSDFETADVVRGPGANAPSIVDSIGGSFVLHGPGLVDANHFDFSTSNDAWGGYDVNSLVQLRVTPRLSAMFGYYFYNTPGPQDNARLVTSAFGQPPATIDGRPFYSCGPGFNSYHGQCSTQAAPGTKLYNTVCSTYQAAYCEAYQVGMVYCCVTADSSWTTHAYSGALTYKLAPGILAQVFYAGSSATDAGGNGYFFGNQFEPTGRGYSGSFSPGVYFLTTLGGVSVTYNDQSSNLLEEKVTANLGPGVLRLAALQNTSYWNASSGPTLGPPSGVYTVYGTGFYCSDPSCTKQGSYAPFNGTKEDLTFVPSADQLVNTTYNRDLLVSYAAQLGDRSSAGYSFVQSYYDNPWSYLYSTYAGVNLCAAQPGYCNGQDSSVSATTQEFRLYGESQISNKFTADASWYFADGAFHVTDPTDSAPVKHQYIDMNFPYNAPRLGMTWRFNPDLVARAAAGGAFALPALGELTGGSETISCITGEWCTQTLSNLNLQPEKSFGIDLGTDARVHRDTVVSFDLYHTNLYGQFYQQVSLAPCTTCHGLPLYALKTENLVHTRYDGLNLAVNHSPRHGIYWNFTLGTTRSYVVYLPPGFYDATPGKPCSAANIYTTCHSTYIIPGINFTGSPGVNNGSIPYANGSASLGYRWARGASVAITSTYFGNNNAYYVPAFVAFNALASYPVTPNVSLNATFSNFTNADAGSNLVVLPKIGGPSAVGAPFPLTPVPIGPRALLVTLNYHQ